MLSGCAFGVADFSATFFSSEHRIYPCTREEEKKAERNESVVWLMSRFLLLSANTCVHTEQSGIVWWTVWAVATALLRLWFVSLWILYNAQSAVQVSSLWMELSFSPKTIYLERFHGWNIFSISRRATAIFWNYLYLCSLKLTFVCKLSILSKNLLKNV